MIEYVSRQNKNFLLWIEIIMLFLEMTNNKVQLKSDSVDFYDFGYNCEGVIGFLDKYYFI